MSAFAFLGGLGGAYNSIRNGMDQEAARMDRDAASADAQARRADAAIERQDNQVLRQDRATMRERLLREQALEDQTREGLAAIQPAGSTDLNKANADTSQVTVDNEGTPSATQLPAVKTRTYDQVLREQAAVLRKGKQTDKAFAMDMAADKIAFGRASAQFRQVVAGAGSADVGSLAKQIGGIFESDPNNGGVKAIENIPGGVRITLHNKDTGVASTREFVGPQAKQQLIDAFSAYYSPETWAKLQADAAAAQQKIALERVKGAGVTSLGRGDAAITDEQGNVTITRGPRDPAAGGASAGGRGKAPPTPLEGARELLAAAAEKSEDKLTSDQRASAEDHLARLVGENPKLPPAMAARLAMKIAKDPASIKPQINIRTGLLDNMVTDDQTGDSFSIRKGVGDALKLPAGVKPEDVQAMTADMLARADAQLPGVKDLYVEAAFDDSGQARVKLESFMKDQTRKAMGAVPGFSQLSPEQQTAAVEKAFSVESSSIQNRLNLVKNYGSAPKKASAPGAIGTRTPGRALGTVGFFGMGDAMVARLAGMDGNPNQKAAIAELERRRQKAAAQPAKGSLDSYPDVLP